jgi:hypothetical protein
LICNKEPMEIVALLFFIDVYTFRASACVSIEG